MTRSINRLLGAIFGGIYIVVGLLGFTVTAGVPFAGSEGGLLLGIFAVNPLHNVAHLLIGAALLIAAIASTTAAKRVNTIVGAAYLLLGVVGLFITDSPLNILALNGADHVLHLGSAIVLLGVGLGAERTATTRA